jgi:hypothetical protein
VVGIAAARLLTRLKEIEFMDAVSWIFLVGLIIVLAGYGYHKGTFNPLKALWHDITKPKKASSNPR